jgi:hypothetical protein
VLAHSFKNLERQYSCSSKVVLNFQSHAIRTERFFNTFNLQLLCPGTVPEPVVFTGTGRQILSTYYWSVTAFKMWRYGFLVVNKGSFLDKSQKNCLNQHFSGSFLLNYRLRLFLFEACFEVYILLVWLCASKSH